jgi:uncharacterized membrane protein
MSTNRLESFSDGVIAVAITLLVLNIDVPPTGAGHHLGHELAANWSQYAAYVVSFLTIGIIWVNHHVMISRLRAADHAILIGNLLLLMTIGILPFATDLIAKHLHEGDGSSLAAAIYAGAFLLMGVAFGLLNQLILLRRTDMLAVEMPLAQRRRILLRSAGGSVPYVVALGVAFVSPYATLAICAAIGIFYAFPVASGPDTGLGR